MGRFGEAYATVGGSFKAPTLEQLYDPRPYLLDPDGPGPAPPIALQVSSHSPRPQWGNHAEAGLRGQIGSRASVDVCGYYSRSTDEIGFDLTHFQYANIAKSVHAGLEASLETRLGARVGARASYSWTRAVFEGGEHDGKQINAVPVHQVCGSLTLHAWHGASVTTGVRYVQAQWLDEMNLYEIPSCAVADLGLIQAMGSFEFFASSRNVFDRRYAGTGYLTIDATGNPLPLYYPGAGRTVLAGLRLAAR